MSLIVATGLVSNELGRRVFSKVDLPYLFYKGLDDRIHSFIELLEHFRLISRPQNAGGPYVRHHNRLVNSLRYLLLHFGVLPAAEAAGLSDERLALGAVEKGNSKNAMCLFRIFDHVEKPARTTVSESWTPSQ